MQQNQCFTVLYSEGTEFKGDTMSSATPGT